MTSNLNLSKSNINRLIHIYYPDSVTQEQAAAILAALDKHGAADDAQLEQLLRQQILPSAGVPASMATSVKSSKSNSSE